MWLYKAFDFIVRTIDPHSELNQIDWNKIGLNLFIPETLFFDREIHSSRGPKNMIMVVTTYFLSKQVQVYHIKNCMKV